MPPPGSEPDAFDDDDDFFSGPAALQAIAAIEQRAIAASQVPKTTQSYHHTVSRPSAGPRAPPPKSKPKGPPPRPVNTEPGDRTGVCGFGWEEGGKNYLRHEARLASRVQGGRAPAHPPIEEDTPLDIVVDARGRYGFGGGRGGPNEEEPVFDARSRPEIRQMVEDAPLRPNERHPEPSQAQPLPGSQARREAIAASRASSEQPSVGMARTTSSTSIGPPANAARLGTSRTLGRSISAGGNLFARGNETSRPPFVAGALPPIPSQGGQLPSSQGAVARRAVVELDEERRRREASEAELLQLRARVAALERKEEPSPWRDEVQSGEGDLAAQVTQLKQQLWAAQGQATNAIRNKDAAESKLKAEIEKLLGNQRDLEAQMRVRDQEAKQRLESMKTQSIFIAHNALASASKVRQHSQYPAAATGGSPMHNGPMHNGGSPMRDRMGMMIPVPLSRSTKGKGRIVAPRFDTLTNAFNITPTVGRKRQRTEAPSPTATPPKTRLSVSPLASPSRGAAARQASPGDEDVQMDWQPDFGGMSGGIPDAAPSKGSGVDPREELIYHLLNHVALSPLQLFYGVSGEPTLLRIMGQRQDLDAIAIAAGLATESADSQAPLPSWSDLCSDLLRLCGDASRSFDEAASEVLRILAGMLMVATVARFGRARPSSDPDAETPLTATLINILRLLSSALLLFPSMLPRNEAAAGVAADQMDRIAAALAAVTAEERTAGQAREQAEVHRRERLDADTQHPAGALEAAAGPAARRKDFADHELPANLWEGELADAVAEVCEAMCLADGRCIWISQLASIIMHLTSASTGAGVVSRGLDLFVAASFRRDHFRAVMFPGVAQYTDPRVVPVVDRVARLLLDGHAHLPPHSERLPGVVAALRTLSLSDPDAIVLMTDKSILVPALLTLLHRASSPIWGVRAGTGAGSNSLDLVVQTVALLHQLVYPPPAGRAAPSQPSTAPGAPGASTAPGAPGLSAAPAAADAALFEGAPQAGVDLACRLQEAGASKEFAGVQHLFVSTLGVLAYADVDADDAAWAAAARPPGNPPEAPSPRAPRDAVAADLRTVQFLAQDLLEAVVEGPEGDSVYELYVSEEDGAESGESSGGGGGGGRGGGGAGESDDGGSGGGRETPGAGEAGDGTLAAPIVIDDEHEYDEEERVMEDGPYHVVEWDDGDGQGDGDGDGGAGDAHPA